MNKIGFLSPAEAGLGSPLVRDYLSGNPILKDFYSHSPLQTDWKKVVESRSNFSDVQRRTLVSALRNGYGNTIDPVSEKLLADLLKPNSYTVTTGHQLSFAGGPLYFFYKMVSAIALARSIAESNPEMIVVPIYWMNSEDSDYEEIRAFHLWSKTFALPENGSGFSTGRMSADAASNIWQEIKSSFERLDTYKTAFADLESAYNSANNLAEATRNLVQLWLADLGILVLDQANPILKTAFLPFIIDDIQGSKSYTSVTETLGKLESLGYYAQAKPRIVNYFYHHPQLGRKRLESDANYFWVKDTDIRFKKDQLPLWVETHLSDLSTNVITRPLYQEVILPNLAYIGGPAEVHYWLQYKNMFDAMGVPFPVVALRDCFMIVQEKHLKKLNRIGLTLMDLSKSTEEITALFLNLNATEEWEANAEKENIRSVFEALSERAADIDESLKAWVKSEGSRAVKSIETIEARLKKTVKEKHSRDLNLIYALMAHYFPEGKMQERHWHILHLTSDPKFFFNALIQHCAIAHPGLKLLSLESSIAD